MAAENTPLSIVVKADTKDVERGMAAAMRAAQREVDQLKRRVDSMTGAGPDRVSRSMQNMRREMASAARQSQLMAAAMRGGGGLMGLAATAVGGFSLAGAQQLLDANTKIQNALKQTGLEGRALAKVYDRLGDIASENGSDFESLARLYQRLSLAGETLGASSQEIIAFTERLAQSIRASGIGGEEAASGIQQLTQAMQSGRLQGDELRSILENLPPVAQAIARGMGVTVGALRELGKQGKLTSREVFDAFMQGSVELAAQAEGTSLTISQGFSAIETAAIRLAGRLDELWAVSSKFGAALGIVAEAMDNTAKSEVIDPNVSRALGGIITDLQSLSEVFDQMEDHEGGKLLAAQYKYLLSILKDGTATAADFSGVIQEARQDGSELGESLAKALEAIQVLFADAEAELRKLNAATDAAVETMSSLDRVLKAVGVQDLAPLIKALQTVSGLLPDLSNLPHDISTALINLPSTLGAILPEAVTATPSAAKSFLKTKAASQKVADRIDLYDDAYATALAKLFTILPSGARIGSGVRTYEEQYDIYYRQKIRPAAKPGLSHHEQRGALRPQAADISGVSPEVLKTAVDSIAQLETLKGKTYERDKMHVQLAGTQRKAEEDLAAATDKRAKSYADLLEQSRQATEMLTIEQEAIANSAGVADSLNYKLQYETQQRKLLNQAKSEGIELTAAERAKIDESAAAFARATVAVGQQREATKLLKEERERQLAVQQEVIQQMSQLAQSAIGGFISDMRAGVSAGEAFNNMLNRIIDSLIQMALQSVFSPTGGIFSGIFGGAAPIGHQGGVVGKSRLPTRLVPRDTFVGAKRYASGTGFRGVGAGEVPIIAHRGEVILPAGMVGRVSAPGAAGGGQRVDASMHGDINIDMSATGLVASSSEKGREWGQHVRTIIQSEMVRESRPGGLLRKGTG